MTVCIRNIRTNAQLLTLQSHISFWCPTQLEVTWALPLNKSSCYYCVLSADLDALYITAVLQSFRRHGSASETDRGDLSSSTAVAQGQFNLQCDPGANSGTCFLVTIIAKQNHNK